jgi:ribosomal RNA-processing protein 8
MEGGRHEVLGFDHVVLDERATACDVAAVPLEDASTDIAVCSLSLMGANRDAYLLEARRILPVDGQLWVAETADHFGQDDERIRNAFHDRGFDVAAIERTEKFLLRAVRSGRLVSPTPAPLFA